MPELISELWLGWLWFAAAAMSISTLIVALVYVLSNLLVNDKMKTWAKMELAEIFYSAVIISIGLGAIATMDGLVQGSLGVSNSGSSVTTTVVPVIVGGTKDYMILDICGDAIASTPGSVYEDIPSCHMRLGIWYMRELFDEAKDFAFSIYLAYIKTSMLSEATINIEFVFEAAGFFTFTPWKGFFTMGNTIKALVFDWAIKIMMLTKFQEVLLRFIAIGLFPALFVIGAILRTFMFTRRLGGLLLGMAIAMYFIFPAFYAYGALVMIDLKEKARPAWMANTDANPDGIPDPPIANMMYINGDFVMLGGAGGASSIFSTSDARASLRDYEGMSYSDYMGLMESSTDPSVRPQFDFSSDTASTDPERQAAMERAHASAQDWFGKVSAESKYDKFVDYAWEPGGPVDTLSRITFWAAFFSLFSIIGTIAAIRSLSITFGGDIEIAGLTRLI